MRSAGKLYARAGKFKNLELGSGPMVKCIEVSEIILKIGRAPRIDADDLRQFFLESGRKPLGNLRGAAKTSLNDAAPVSTKGN
jgi:hypothetical protein